MLRIYRSLAELPSPPPNCVTTIGNFDGVHIGHQHLFQRVIALAAKHGWVSSVLTFDPHPTKVVAPSRAPRLLTTVEHRARLIEEEGIEQLVVLPFDKDFAGLGPDEFARVVLSEGVSAKAVLVGENFHFGKGQAGNVDTLRALGERYGFFTEIAGSVFHRGGMVSSSAARRLLEGGEVSKAARMLGRPYELEGKVVRGHGIGSRQTVPTLNLETKAEVLPLSGVYITHTRDLEDGRSWPSITNIGTRPTFDGDRLTIETFLLEPLEGDTPAAISVAFLRRVREERKFESPDALKRQILKDVSSAQKYFRRTARNGALCYHRHLVP